MQTQILSGKPLAQELRKKIKVEVEMLRKRGVVPSLASVLVGDDPASARYVASKQRMCKKVGIRPISVVLPRRISQQELVQYIEKLNNDAGVHGIIVQLPLPNQIDVLDVVARISPLKDVDGFHPENMGLLMSGRPRFTPPTPAGIVELLDYYNIALEGKKTVIVGRSLIVGKPLALLMLSRNSTIQVCHSKTVNLAEQTKQADIAVLAVGKPRMFGADYFSSSSIVIDVGTNLDENANLVGDVNFAEVSSKVKAITPVPGGVGPLTVVMLLHNTVKAAKLSASGGRGREPFLEKVFPSP